MLIFGITGGFFENQKQPLKMKIFLFHAKGDKDVAEILHKKLVPKYDVSIWIENDNYAPTPDRKEAIYWDIKEAEFIIILFSDHAFSRRRRELLIEFVLVLAAVKELSKPDTCLIPILLDDSILPSQVQNRHCFNIFEEGGLEQVLRVMEKTANKKGEQQDEQNIPVEEFAFYKDNWEWILRFQDEEIIANHRYETGFTYLHFIINSGMDAISIHSLKKITTKIYQPQRYELWGLNEDWEEEENKSIELMPYEVLRQNMDLFRKIRDEIIYSIQSIQGPKILDYFLKSIKFSNDYYIIFNTDWLEKIIKWKLYN